MQSKILSALVAGLVCASNLTRADEPAQLTPIIVTATRIATADVDATFATEVHTRDRIEASGAASLYDYLAQHTSVQVMPSYGSRAAPLIDMRGYGLESGYQNIVVSLDGRRLNAIDMNPQLLAAIPLADIERIEVTKGSGSVLYGDGATAGSIQIYTHRHERFSLAASVGDHGARAGTLAGGVGNEQVRLSLSADYAASDGGSDTDVSGHRDTSLNRVWRGTLEMHPVDRLRLDVDGSSARIDSRFLYPLTLVEFDSNPAQFPASCNYATPCADPYTHNRIADDHLRFAGNLTLAPDWSLQVSHGDENKRSQYIGAYDWGFSYDIQSDELALRYRGGQLDASLGVQVDQNTRHGSSDQTHKDNTGAYAQGQYRHDLWTFSAGGRIEKVDYAYDPSAAPGLKNRRWLQAWDMGVNRRVDEALTFFVNLDQAFQAPDVDRFFTYNFGVGTYAFNAFIVPEKSRTLSVGINHVQAENRLKLSVFRADLHNEIYYNPATWSNTNLDRSHKYGLELQDSWRFAQNWSTSLNYTYTRAIIDRESVSSNSFNGKDLPGVPRQGVVLGLSYAPSAKSSFNLTHTWRSSAWAIGDFANSNLQRQAAYQSTDLSYRQKVDRFDWLLTVQNLFEHRNGLWTGDDQIYPVNFTRSFRLGVSTRF